MKISVAMCTYNGADFLSAQLGSILAQSRKPDEIVVCDDGSGDDTRRVLQGFAKQSDVPISLHFNENNLGSVKNFEQAIRLCQGDVIALSDQDDVWRSDKLQLIEQALGKKDIGLVFSDAELVDETLQPLARRMWPEIGFDANKRKLLRAGRALEVLVTGWTVTGATMAFRSQFRDFALPVPEGIAMIHDGWIALAVACVSGVAALDEPLIKYRQHYRQQIGAPARVQDVSKSGRIERWETALRRRNSNNELQEILSVLKERLLAHSGVYESGKALSFVEDYSSHLRVRANLPRRRLQRLPRILRELFSLRYHEYGNGLRSAAKDLVS